MTPDSTTAPAFRASTIMVPTGSTLKLELVRRWLEAWHHLKGRTQKNLTLAQLNPQKLPSTKRTNLDTKNLNLPSYKLPGVAGVGLRHPHVASFIEHRPTEAGWLEIHTENYLGAGGPRLSAIEKIREHYPLSCHGVGASLGSAAKLDECAMQRRKEVIDRLLPVFVSEHIAWSVSEGNYLNELLPLPYTEESLKVLCQNIDHFQTLLKRQILIENPATYLTFSISKIPEAEFMAELAQRSGCGLLLDVNNVHVSTYNHGMDARVWIDALLERAPVGAIQEIHVAGHFVSEYEDETILIDDHGSRVSDIVWALLRLVLQKLGPIPILVEWDTKIPELPILIAEAEKASRLSGEVVALQTNNDAHHVK